MLSVFSPVVACCCHMYDLVSQLKPLVRFYVLVAGTCSASSRTRTSCLLLVCQTSRVMKKSLRIDGTQ
jgi:hypothetical protein